MLPKLRYAILVRDDTLSQLATLNPDAKDFRWRQMSCEREKRATREPLSRIAKALLPRIGISQQNIERLRPKPRSFGFP